MRVYNIGSNMTQVDFDNGTKVLVSYQEPVAAYIPGSGNFRTEVNWSNTTGRHISKWGNRDSERKPQQFFYDLMKNDGYIIEPTPEPVVLPMPTKRPRVRQYA